MPRSFTFSADDIDGNAAAQALALFADATFPIQIRLTNFMARKAVFPALDLTLGETTNLQKRTAIVKIRSRESLQRLFTDIESITEARQAKPSIGLTDDVAANVPTTAPDVFLPALYSPTAGLFVNNVKLFGADEITVLRQIAQGGGVNAAVKPRPGTLAALLGIAGLDGEVAYPTDKPRLRVLYNGVLGGARVEYLAGAFGEWDYENRVLSMGDRVTNSDGDTDQLVIGVDTSSDGSRGFAIGIETRSASGGHAIGNGAEAEDGGTACGMDTYAGTSSTVVGNGADAAGSDCVAVGQSARCDQDQGTAAGTGALAEGPSSTAIGCSARAQGDDSVAVGFGVYVKHPRMVAVGHSATRQYLAALTSTAAAQNVLLNVATGPEVQSGYATGVSFGLMRLTVVASTGDGAAVATFQRHVSFRRTAAGVLTIANTQTIGADYIDAALSGIAIALSAVSGAVQVACTGKAATNIRWNINAEAMY